MTPNIKFQPDRIFVRNDLFERIIKSCKATNAEFTMLKEKLGICLYEENYYEEKIKIQDDIEESEEELIEKYTVELSEESDEDTDEELIEIISPKKDENTTDWYDTNKFKIVLTTIDSNNFNHKNKIGELKFNDINSLINNIKKNAISEADARIKLNALNEIKKAEIKSKSIINGQKKLLNLFDDLLEAIFNNNNVSVNKDNNESANEIDNESDSDSDSENENGDGQYHVIKQLNNYLRTIGETKSFEEQIEILKKRDFLDEYWHVRYYHGNKELNLKIFKAKAAYLLNDLDEQLFERIFGHMFVALADKVINTTSKEENKIITDNVKKNRDNIYEQDDFSKNIMQLAYKRGDLLDAVKIILEFNEVLS